MGQRLTLTQSLGVFMIISGVTLAALNWKEIKHHQFKLSMGIKETVIGAFFFAVFWNISEIISEEIGWLSTKLLVKAGIIEAMAVALVNYGLTIGDAILITPIASALSIVTIVLAILFLKDRVTKLQGAGMLTAVAGIIVTGL